MSVLSLWSLNRNEWISVSSKRIISRHSDKKDKLQDGNGGEGSKPVRCSFELIGKVASIVKVDASMSSLLPHIASGRSEDVLGLSLADDDSPLVLVHIVEPSLSVSVFLWMKLSLLRVARPRSAVPTTHYPVVPTPSSLFVPNRATFAAQAADIDALLSIATTHQSTCVAHTANRILNEYIHASQSLQLSVRANIALLSAISPASLRSVTDYSHAESSHVLMGAAHDGRSRLVELTERVDKLAAVIRAAMEREAERAREAKPPVTATPSMSSGAALSSRSSLSQPAPPLTPRASSAPTSVVDSYCMEIQKLITELATSLPALSQSCRSFSLTHVSPTSSMEVRCDHPDVNLQLVSVMPLSDAEAKNDKNITASSSTATWCIHLYADESRTVLLKELIITIDPSTRMLPPFLVPNPVYITAAVVKGKAGKSKSGKDTLPDGQVTLSITPFTTHALESLYTVVSLLCLLRRSYSPSIPLSALSIIHVRKLEALMKLAANTLSDHISRLHRVLPVPSNIKARGYECVAKLLATLTFSHVQMTAIIKREKERERMEIIDRERDRQREAALRDRRDARKQGVLEERKEADDDNKRVKDDGSSTGSAGAHHSYTSPPAHPHPHSSLLRSSSSSSSSAPNPSSLPPSSPSPPASTASSLPSWQSELIDLHWMPRIVLHEAKLRLVKEKPYSPLHSVYLQRLIELLVAALRYEKLVINSKYWEVKLRAAHPIASSGRQRSAEKDGEAGGKLLEIVRQPVSNELVAVLSVERLLMLATDPRAHPPLAGSTGEQRECDCVWCKLLDDARDQTSMAMPLMDLSPRSMIHTFISDMDHFPDSIITGQLTLSATTPVSGDGANVPAAPPLSSVLAAATSAFAGSISSLSSMFGSGSPSHSPHSHAGGPSSAPAALPNPSPAMRSRSEEKSPALYNEQHLPQHGDRMLSSFGSASRSSSLLTTSLSPSAGSANASSAALSPHWRDRLHIAERLLPSPNVRSRIFNLLLNSTAHPNHARPEIAFRRGSDQSGDDASSAAAASAVTAATGTGARVDDDALLQRQSMFQQLCDAFVKGGFHRQAAPLRAEVSTVTWKTILAGALDQGAAGLPGPFRQALHEICAYLNATAANPLQTNRSLLIPCPNSRSQTGDDRNKLMVNPSLASESALVHYRVFGQLMGIAIRSKCALDLDLSECFWKQIVGQPLHASDLPSFDFTAARSLAFCDPVTEQPFNSEEWNEYLADLTYTTVASDNQTVLELIAGGVSIRVPYSERHNYRRLATHARLYEAALQIAAIRGGLHSIIPEQAIELLSWQELELRVCGRPTVDLDTLKKHTVYSPSTYSLSSPIVQQFWQVLASFTPDELAAFLQFAWARSRLPSEMGSYRMQINILDKANTASLPTAETCLTGDHMVLTRSGWRSIKTIVKGDIVASLNKSSWAMEWKKVKDRQKAPHKAGAKQLWRMQGEGMDVVATSGHRMLTARTLNSVLSSDEPLRYDTVTELLDTYGFASRPTSHTTQFEYSSCRKVVRSGINCQPDYQLSIPELTATCSWWWRKDRQLNFLRFFGFWLGDGMLDVTHELVGLTQRKLESTAWLIDLLDELFPRWWRRQTTAVDEDGTTFRYVIRCPPLYRWLQPMAAGPVGYNPRDPNELRAYPHFTPDAGLAAHENANRYRLAHSTKPERVWSEPLMLAAFARGPPHCHGHCSVCGEADRGISISMLSCSGEACRNVGSITRAHPTCADATDKQAAFEEPWYCCDCGGPPPVDLEQCWWCGEPDSEPGNELLECDGGCGSYGHLSCAGLSEVPEDDWRCPDCQDEQSDEQAESSTAVPTGSTSMQLALSPSPAEQTAAEDDDEMKFDPAGSVVPPPSASNIDTTHSARRTSVSVSTATTHQSVSSASNRKLSSSASMPSTNADAMSLEEEEGEEEEDEMAAAVEALPDVLEDAAAVVAAQAVGAIVWWNNALWWVINGNWFYLKRWMGANVASTFASLSQRQAVALLEGFCRADDLYARVAVDKETGEGCGRWQCSSSSFPLIDHLMLIGQLAGARVDLRRLAKAGQINKINGREVKCSVDHWELWFNFNKKCRAPVPITDLAKPLDVSTDLDERGYYAYVDDGFVYCLIIDSSGDTNSNFLTQRLSTKRHRGKKLSGESGQGVKAHPVFVGNCFFNVNVPKYDSIDVMTSKIKMALLCGTITS